MHAPTTSVKHIPNQKGSKRRIRLALALLLLVFVWAIVTAIGQAGKLRDRAKQFASLEAQRDDVLKVNVEAKKEIDRLNDPEYKKEMIRKQLGYAYPGDVIFDVPKKR